MTLHTFTSPQHIVGLKFSHLQAYNTSLKCLLNIQIPRLRSRGGGGTWDSAFLTSTPINVKKSKWTVESELSPLSCPIPSLGE